jgi:hypothetical protein
MPRRRDDLANRDDNAARHDDGNALDRQVVVLGLSSAPSQVTLDGKQYSSFRYDGGKNILEVTALDLKMDQDFVLTWS